MGYIERVECRVYRDLIDNVVGQLGQTLPEKISGKLESIEYPEVLHDVYFMIIREYFKPRDPTEVKTLIKKILDEQGIFLIDKPAIKQAVKDEWFAELVSIHLKEGKDRDYIMNALMINVDG